MEFNLTDNKSDESLANIKQIVCHPWRRYLARMLDVSIYTMLWLALLALVFNENILNRSGILSYIDQAIAIITMLFLEPLILRIFGTTIGKKVFGLYLRNENGENPTYLSGFNRTFLVIKYGMGYQIPFYNIYRLWKSYKSCTNKEDLEWNDELVYSIKDTKLYRGFIFVLLHIFIIFIAILVNAFAQLPSNRGDLTISEFAENYNKLSSYYKIETAKYLNENGKWVDKPVDGRISIDIFNTPLTTFEFTTENNNGIRGQAPDNSG